MTVVGGGLAGSELSLQLACRGVPVHLVEMRPATGTPAHRSGYFAELVCSNSLKSELTQTASGLLKEELHLLGCRLLSLAESMRLPAGHALAVDRDIFARGVTESIRGNPLVTIERREQRDLDLPFPGVIATGPLTSDDLSTAISTHFGREHLHFYDAISISVDSESVDYKRMYRASRYGKGGADYWNVPFSREEYLEMIGFLRDASKTERRGFEEKQCFEACLPIEILAGRGEDALRFGPFKPRGLPVPDTGKEPYAVLQLRQETADGTMLGLVGCQTRLTRTAQRELLSKIPGLGGASILRWGSIHRNTFLDAPDLLDDFQMSKKREGLFFSGQLVGVEGYMESIAHGLLTAYNLLSLIGGNRPQHLPPETLLGALQRHLVRGGKPFQPMNANFGLLPSVTCPKKEKKRLLGRRSLETLKSHLAGRQSRHWKVEPQHRSP